MIDYMPVKNIPNLEKAVKAVEDYQLKYFTTYRDFLERTGSRECQLHGFENLMSVVESTFEEFKCYQTKVLRKLQGPREEMDASEEMRIFKEVNTLIY